MGNNTNIRFLMFISCVVFLASLNGCSLGFNNSEISKYQNCEISLDIFQWGGSGQIEISGSIRDRWGNFVEFDGNNTIRISGKEGRIEIDTPRITRKYNVAFSDTVIIEAIIEGETIWKSKYKIHDAPEIRNLGEIGSDTVKFDVSAFGYYEIIGGSLIQFSDSIRYGILRKSVEQYCSKDNPYIYSMHEDILQNDDVDSIEIKCYALSRYVTTSDSNTYISYSDNINYCAALARSSINHPYAPTINISQTGHTRLNWKYKHSRVLKP